MPKVFVCEDEAFPVYTISSSWGREAELTEAELARGKEVEKAYEEWQEKLDKIYWSAFKNSLYRKHHGL